MKIIIVLLIFLNLHLFSIDWTHFSVNKFNNADLTNVSNIYQLKNTGQIWLSTKNGQFIYENGKINQYKDDNFNIIGNLSSKIFEDNYNNKIFFFNQKGLLFLNDNNSYRIDVNNTLNFESLRDVLLINDTIVAFGKSKIYLILYNKSSNRYELNNENILRYNYEGDEISLTGPSLSINNEIYLTDKSCLYRYNLNSSTLELKYNFSNLIGDKYLLSKYINYNNNNFIISTVNKDTTSSLIFINKDFISSSEIIIDDKSFPYNPQITDLTFYQDLMLISYNTSLFNVNNNKLYEISKPENIINENIEWNLRKIFIDKSDTVWIGTFQNGIFKCHINDILEVTSVEDDKYLGLKKLNILKIYPIPNNSNEITIEYNNLLNNNEIEVFLYNNNGQIVNNDFYRIISNQKNGENFYILKLEANNLNPGIYFIKLSVSNTNVFEKIIIK